MEGDNVKINWKVRLKNPVFWLTVIPTVLTILYAIFDLCGIAPRVTEETVTKALVSLFDLLAMLGIVVDHTTNGIGDSERAMTYDKPYKQEVDYFE